MNMFLRAKHWQLLILIFGSAILSDMETMFSTFFLLTFFGLLNGLVVFVSRRDAKNGACNCQNESNHV